MMADNLAPFIKWGSFRSIDEKNPDILHLRAVETQPFETQYSTCVRVKIRDGTTLTDAILNLKSHESANASLLNQWNKLAESGKIKHGAELTLRTWLGQSKYNKRPIRRFAIEV